MTPSRLLAVVGALLVGVVAVPAWADEYPKVVRRDGQVCVQELAADGAVKESCRAETAPQAPAATEPSGSGWSNRFQPNGSPRLLEGGLLADPKGAPRGIAELFGGQVAAFATASIFVATGVGAGVTGQLASSLVVFGVSSLASGLLHTINDGQAGLGWAFLGNALGSVASFVIAVLALSTSSVVLIAMTLLVGSLLPPLGAAIALELRDTALRREGAGFAPSAAQSRPGGAVLANF
jgi:hypothetical protein